MTHKMKFLLSHAHLHQAPYFHQETAVSCSATDSDGNITTETFQITVTHDPELVISAWIKNVAEFWCTDKIDDGSFIEAVQHLIENDIIVLPDEYLDDGSTGTDGSSESGIHHG